MTVDNDDVFMQTIIDKQRAGEPLTHVEIELVRRRGFEEELRRDIHELLEAWRAATGTLKFLKFISTWGAIIGGLWALFKTGLGPGEAKP